jgi:hypothetical protein
MRPAVVLFASLALLGFAASARAKSTILVPPGNSSVSQYVESVPTAGGGRPSGSIHTGVPPSNRSGGGGGPISPSTVRQLHAQGAAGTAAAALAVATAPSRPRSPARVSQQPPPPSGGGASPLSSVVKALTGSSSSGGLGLLLPIILVATLLCGTLVAVLRRRTS